MENLNRELRIDEILFETNYPILFTCTIKDELYICLCNEVRDYQGWIMAKVTEETVINMLTNKIPVKDCFKNKEEILHKVKWTSDSGFEVKELKFEELDPLELPRDNDFLDPKMGEFDKYIATLITRIWLR